MADGVSHIFEKTFHRFPDGIIFTDKNKNLLDANKAILNMLQITRDEIFRSFEQLSDYYTIYNSEHQKLPVNLWPVSRVSENETFYDEEIIVEIKKTNKVVYMSCTGLPHFDENGDFEAGILIIRDISELTKKTLKSKNTIDNQKKHLSQLKNLKNELSSERELLQTIIDTIPVMITIYNATVDSIVLNDAFTQITGWTQKDVEDKNVMELAYPDPEYRAEILEFMNSEQSHFKDIVMHTKDDREVETSWANVKIADGRQVGVGIDISARKKLENELIIAKEKAEKENQIQYAFIQNISHEVRTPMNSILGFTELLRKIVDDSQGNEFLDAISVNGKQLLRLIEDIIDISRLDKNEMSLTKKNVNVAKLMKRMGPQLEGLKKALEKSHIETSIKIPKNTDNIFVYTDATRIQQVLTNFISNALKYTEKGKVEIGFEVHDHEEVIFYVKDTGIGIKEENFSRVFTRFNRFYDRSSGSVGGTGLGLAICKHFVNLLGGTIDFSSEYGKGSVFKFTHPYTLLEDEATEILKVTDEKKDFSLPDLDGKTVLIAEDDKFSFMLMEQMLIETKADVLHAETGKEAVELFIKGNADVVFLDIRMPEMSGFQAIRKIRELNNSVPVIAQTANAMNEDRQNIILSGFNYHATKPISQNELYSILNKFL